MPLDSYGWGPFAERFLEAKLKKAKNFKEAQKIMAMESHILACAEFIEELMKLRAPEPDDISADIESEFYKRFYKSPDMSLKTTGDTSEPLNHADFYL